MTMTSTPSAPHDVDLVPLPMTQEQIRRRRECQRPARCLVPSRCATCVCHFKICGPTEAAKVLWPRPPRLSATNWRFAKVCLIIDSLGLQRASLEGQWRGMDAMIRNHIPPHDLPLFSEDLAICQRVFDRLREELGIKVGTEKNDILAAHIIHLYKSGVKTEIKLLILAKTAMIGPSGNIPA